MNRYFAIFHGLVPSAPWGVAVAPVAGGRHPELLLLCRTEQEATQLAEVTRLGQEAQQLASRNRIGK